MVRTKKWPILYENILRVKNPDHPVGVVTLWTERDIVKSWINDTDYCAIGNLYSAAGINHIIRNVFANPAIRYLVMWGADLSASGYALNKFMQNGVDGDRNIVGASGAIEKEIPVKALATFRKNIELIDLRGKPKEEIAQAVKKLKVKPPFAKKPQIFPIGVPQINTLPSEQVGFKVSAASIAQTWLKVLNVINNYGRIKKTRYASTNELKEILNLTAVVTAENPKEVYFPHYLPFSKQELAQYYSEFQTRRIPGTSYNYGYRWRIHFGIDQVERLKKLLKKRPDSKKMILVTYDVKEDTKNLDRGDTPCITQINASVQDNKFFMTAHVRSQDMFHAWPRNMFGALSLQKEIADSAGYDFGYLTMITHSAHIYADDWSLTRGLLDDYYEAELKYKRGFHFHEDPRGNWVIEACHTKKLISAKLYTNDMATVLKSFEGATAREVAWRITDWELISLADHAASIGIELSKAEVALQLGIEYNQDKPLDYKKMVQEEKIPASPRYVKKGKKMVKLASGV